MKTVGLLLLLLSLPALAKSEISGNCLVIDGDTIHVMRNGNTTKVRLHGIAAPEMDQPGGKEATAFLERYAEGKPVRCILEETRTEKFEIGTCYMGGQDIAAAVVKSGFARVCPSYSGCRYRALESANSRKLFFPNYCKQ